MELKRNKPDQTSLRPGRAPNQAAIMLAIMMFSLAFSISSLYARSIQQQTKQDFQTKLSQEASILQSYTSSSVEGYGRLLLSSAALFSLKPDATKEDWLHFYEVSQMENNFPSIVGMGYATAIPADQVGAFEQQQREAGRTDFKVSTTLSSGKLGVITYLAPSSTENNRALGYDMFSEPVRRVAMEQARDMARVVMTAPVHLVQDQDNASAKGVLMYFPIYEGQATPGTVDERRSLLRGYVYVVLRPADVLSRFIDSRGSEFSDALVKVADVTDRNNPVALYDLSNAVPTSEQSTDTLLVDTRTWQFNVDAKNTDARLVSPLVLFILGTIVSMFLAGMTYWLVRGRIKKITTIYEGEVQRTKDELLALASHQLRTPASGVKQYLGILNSGMLGELSEDQQSVVTKAYEANERQLQIINELLYVSKADAGQLVIGPKKFNLTSLTRRCIDDVQEQAAQKNISIIFPTKRRFDVTADDRYIAMAIDNLVNNAIKYSYPSSSIRVGITSHGGMVSWYVTDKGVGVAAHDMERIFGKFDRVDNPLSHSEGGSGLGLFLARQLARTHGGDVTVRSKLGKGSTFTLTLPKNLTLNDTIVNLEYSKAKKEEEI